MNIEHVVLPNGEGVDFDPQTHTYTVRGREVPSITTIIKNVCGDHYGAVNPEVLARAAEYGTNVHADLARIIEYRQSFPDAEIISGYPEVLHYFEFVEPIYHIKPLLTEKMVVLYDPDNNPVAAGRFDLLCLQNDTLTLADFKTTSSINRKSVTYQLNLYRIAAAQSGYPVNNGDIALGVIHLNGKASKFTPITKLNDTFYLQFIR